MLFVLKISLFETEENEIIRIQIQQLLEIGVLTINVEFG